MPRNQQPVLKGLTTTETFEIKGRGSVHIVKLPTEFIEMTDPRTLTGKVVELDKKNCKVRGVETYAMPWRPGSRIMQDVGLLI